MTRILSSAARPFARRSRIVARFWLFVNRILCGFMLLAVLPLPCVFGQAPLNSSPPTAPQTFNTPQQSVMTANAVDFNWRPHGAGNGGEVQPAIAESSQYSASHLPAQMTTQTPAGMTADADMNPTTRMPNPEVQPVSHSTSHPAPAGSAAPTVSASAASVRSIQAAETKHTPLAPPKNAARTNAASTSGSLQSLVSVSASLALVIGLFLGSVFVYRRLAGKGFGKTIPDEVFCVLGRVTLAPKQQMLVIQFGPKLVLMSLIQGEARCISEIDDPEDVHRLLELCQHPRASTLHKFQDQASTQSPAKRELAFPVPQHALEQQDAKHRQRPPSSGDLQQTYREILKQGASI
ncbi:MAG: hypothetical protein NXI32_07295 [bacterium]|nr:hypothetical protein [bacterium]